MHLKESEIRQSIAKNLNKLDESLKLISEEHCISFTDGRRAYIDILAKDDFGCFTIIEIKKSDKTARSAIQQMYKYASFLKEKNRIEHSNIRCIILSTVWSELEAPFAEFCKFSNYETKGYAIELKKDQIPSFKEVIPDFKYGNTQPLHNFLLFHFKEKKGRDDDYIFFQKILNKLSSFNCVLIKFDFNGEELKMGSYYHFDSFPFGFSLVSFTGNVDNIEKEISESYLDVDDDLENHLDKAYIHSLEATNVRETKSRTKILYYYLKHSLNLEMFRAFAPHTFNNISSICDSSQPISKGTMFSDGLFDNNEIVHMCNGYSGLHPYTFMTVTTPERESHFNEIRKRVHEFLKVNNHWQSSVNFILSNLDISDKVQIEIYNPMNLFGFMNDLFEDNYSNRIPQFKIIVVHKNGNKTEYYGALYWTKELKIIPPEQAIEKSYPSIDYFRIRSVSQSINEYDEALSSLYGLTYEVICLNTNTIYSIQDEKWLNCDIQKLSKLDIFHKRNDSLVDDVGMLFKKLKIGHDSKGILII